MLSALLLCSALTPLSELLTKTDCRSIYHGKTICHLMYMHNLKMHSTNDKQVETVLQIVHGFSKEIKKFGLEKCATTILKTGELVKNSNIIL